MGPIRNIARRPRDRRVRSAPLCLCRDNDAALRPSVLFRSARRTSTMAHELGAALSHFAARNLRHRRAGFSGRPSCDGRDGHRDHARRHGGGMAPGALPASRRRVPVRLRLFHRRIPAAPGRGTGRTGGASPRLAGAPRLDAVAGWLVRPPRRASRCPRCCVQPEICQPLRLRLGVQADPLFARAGEPAAGHQPRPPRAAVGAARLWDRAARRGQPRLSARARRPA